MVVAVVGKTSSGKDTIAHHLVRQMGYDQVVTYTLRPQRDYEEDGVQHFFISPEERSKYKDSEIFAPTTVGGYEYFTLKSQFKAEDANLKRVVYIVDPNGVDDLRSLGVDLFVIYVELPESIILERALERGDNPYIVRKRLDLERNLFDAFRDSKKYDYLVDNTQPLDVAVVSTLSAVRAWEDTLKPGDKFA